MPRQQGTLKRRPAPVEESEEPSSGDDDAPEELTNDQLRALKRFKANIEDDGDSEENSEPDEDGVSDGGGAHGTDNEDEDDDEDEDEDDGDGDSDSDGSDSEDDDDERTLEEQVADVPFEVLETLRQDGRGLVGQAARAAAARAAAAERSFKRANKDRPQEMSSKRPVGRFREVIQLPSKGFVDPRFASASAAPPGKVNDSFRRRYAFLYDDMLPEEKRELQDKIKKEKNPKFKAKMQAQLQRIDTQLRDEDLRRRTRALESEWKTKERSAVAGGKAPFFLKESEKKRLALLAKYQELKEHGKLDKFMEKRRKKNAAKDHRYLPSGRRQQQDS
ncbi:hypothetical protein Agub_g932 [Astrephomene gubernaculifera]|uniref:rRNA biogenesis protein RRP36 n=1 Tax=Astrephomene gubernaculifera TaxID=47775 RepID=A0AAD3DGL0_9CHLO|nr:hypothetical protein Agub_g932 [Astrephomene gubernaculifera]